MRVVIMLAAFVLLVLTLTTPETAKRNLGAWVSFADRLYVAEMGGDTDASGKAVLAERVVPRTNASKDDPTPPEPKP